jgi:hypothetical protein
MCRNGQYTERGIKQIDGYMSEQWRIEPEYAIKVDPTLGILGVLLEPTTVVSKAWEMVKATGQRSFWEPSWHSWRSVIGPIGLKWPSFTVSTLIETGFFEDKRRSSLVSRNTHQGHELLNSQTPEVHGKWRSRGVGKGRESGSCFRAAHDSLHDLGLAGLVEAVDDFAVELPGFGLATVLPQQIGGGFPGHEDFPFLVGVFFGHGHVVSGGGVEISASSVNVA